MLIDVVEPESDEAEDKDAKAAAAAAFEQALANLVEMRRREGGTLGQILNQRMDEIEKLARKAEASPGRKPEAIEVLQQLERSDAQGDDVKTALARLHLGLGEKGKALQCLEEAEESLTGPGIGIECECQDALGVCEAAGAV